MIRYLILAQVDENVRYRGIDRPQRCDGVVNSGIPAEVLDEWKQRCADPWGSFLPKLEDADRLAQRYANRGMACEILATAVCESARDAEPLRSGPGRFIGFDVSDANIQQSLLRMLPARHEPIDTGLGDWIPIWALEDEFLNRSINEFGLLPEYRIAAVARDANNAMRRIVNPSWPGTYLDVQMLVFAVSLIMPSSR